ncbi:hypothetical protein GWO43_26060 [candidate division KSB1 bacterium]|nr:hypothetical protein [candidate division KSB1 bacterium]NIV70226.1 hypothetical protein [Phycisphaerae bacterium]NIR71114.1 hypothetical protein [candidate division KSB1 bacterium]NIS26130.1 hypothetical protein [candidate division KSB1 bacterium]NIT74276.1 hypothetical protein [candidate division KSB1 bacterium]
MTDDKKVIGVKGKFMEFDSLRIQDKDIVITGKLVKIARVAEEWYEDIEDPALLIKAFKNGKSKVDIFTFWQRLPDTKPEYEYYMEWDSIAAIPVQSFDHWWKEQIDFKARNKIRKAKKKGVEVRVVDFNDDFIKGMISIFNETPIRQNKPFWHYGKDFETVKQEFSRNLRREEIIGAYYGGDLIGFMMLAYAGEFAMTTQIISKIGHRDKASSNALIARAVEICDQKNVPYFVYTKWSKGSLGDFKRHNGFEKIDLPRYYIPLTFKGKIVLKLKLHRGIRGILPEKLNDHLVNLRRKWYTIKYRKVKAV